MIVQDVDMDFEGFQANPRLKKINTKIDWTEEHVQEYMRCAQDVEYFCNNYVKIINDGELMNFNPRPYQQNIIQAIHNNDRVIALLPRQSGKTTSVTAYILHYILFNQHRTAAFLANKRETALELLGRVHFAYQHLPIFLQQGIIEWNKGSIVLENGSRAIATATGKDAISGYTINLLILDEVAKIENWDEFASSVIPTVSSNKTAKIVQISTPKGLNHFYQTWMMAQPEAKLPNGYVPITINWDDVPGRDQDWKRKSLEELNNDETKWNQEYGCEFLGSSGTLINGATLKTLLANVLPPIFQNNDATLRKYKEPIKNHNYAMCCDVSEGKGFDYSIANVIDVTSTPYEQVCVFQSNNTTPHEFAQILYELGSSYNEAMVLIEHSSLGPQVSDALLHDYNYGNILATKSYGTLGKKLTTETGNSVDLGLKMTQTTRRIGTSITKLLIESHKLLLPDFATVSELTVFSREEGKTKFEAETGYHDDLVMTLVIFAWLSDQDYFRESTNIKTLTELRDLDQKQLESDLIPLGFCERYNKIEDTPISYNHNDLMFKTKDGTYKSWIEIDPDDCPPNF